jgi:2-dehydropantoate 2-reductase
VGVIDAGRYPSGVDAVCEELTDALNRSGFSSKPRPDIMRFKYAKLLANLGNAVDAICEPGETASEVTRVAQEEGKAALSAAGVEFVAEEVNDVQARWERLELQPIEGRPRAGSSTRQSLVRGAATVETDYLNGEISLLGRLHGVPTPVNDALCELSDRHVRDRRPPGTLPAGEVLDRARAGKFADGPVRR